MHNEAPFTCPFAGCNVRFTQVQHFPHVLCLLHTMWTGSKLYIIIKYCHLFFLGKCQEFEIWPLTILPDITYD